MTSEPRRQAPNPPGLDTAVQFLRGVGPRYVAALEKLEIRVVRDLLFHFPRRYEDRRNFRPLGTLMHGEVAVTSGRVVSAAEEQSRRRGMSIGKVVVQDHSGVGELVFFNQPWVVQVFTRLKGRVISIYGTAQLGDRCVQFQHPEWEELTDDEGSLHVRRIVPIHAATEGITPKWLRGVIWTALQSCGAALPEPLPPEVLASHQLPRIGTSLLEIHFPRDEQHLEAARRRLVFDELFRMQCAIGLQSRAMIGHLPAAQSQLKESDLEELRRGLPFEFTSAQERVIREIRDDLAADRPMHRLLQGDVGSGKTVVAAAGILTAIRSGYQAAMLVPTEILAEQHYSVFRRILEPLGVRCHRLVGSVRAKGKRTIKEELDSGFCNFVVGTHALLEDDVTFKNLGLIIVDEQHRFGVTQRLTLKDKGMITHQPDLLVMTATPIPRSLALTAYGNLEVSIIDELPPGRKPIRTHWKRESQRDSVYRGIRKLISEGRQAFVVCPLVEQSDKMQAQAATELYESLRTEVFPDLKVGLLHGQLPSHEKDEIMERFRDREFDVLVATVVIEVGVDVPNASCMVIENAERFGLAQLHQLRGRVGRGEHQSFCVLLADPKTPDGERRIEVLVRTNDGFEIADEDLKIRGPGEFLGTKQAGLFRLRIANIAGDGAILEEARRAARTLLQRDPDLSLDEHQTLRTAVLEQFRDLSIVSVG